MTRRAGLLLIGSLMPSPAFAQYRDGLPPVLSQPHIARPEGANLAGFKTAYQRARAPRLIIFWNRALTDSVSSSREIYADSNSDVSAESTSSRRGATYDESTSTSTRIGVRRLDEGTRSGLSERQDWAAEQGFNRTLLQNGVRLIDRTMAIRATSAGKRGDDTIRMETAALQNKADLLVEVLQTPDSSAPSGYAFRVDVKDVRSGALIANVVTAGNPPRGKPRFVAGENGYERERPRPPSTDAVGAQVAQETLLALLSHWR